MNRFHAISATTGAGALVSLGVFTAAAANPQTESGSFASSGMSTGVTVTQNAASTTPGGMSAAPSIKGPAPLPAEEQGLPGN
jgi:hypothetical protein